MHRKVACHKRLFTKHDLDLGVTGAVTFGKRVVCSFMFKNLSELKSGKECDGFYTHKRS